MSDERAALKPGFDPAPDVSAPLLSGFATRDGTGVAKPSAEFSVAEEHRYRSPQLLGMGGMGRVVAVHDRRLCRDVALKVPNPDTPLAVGLDSRLEREARITARLDHPGILPILDAGVGVDGRSYYTMPIVRGRSLADVLHQTKEPQARLRLLRHVLAACEAMAWAHRQGIVHCDLKPANIMIGEGGGVRVLDWGLARDHEEVELPSELGKSEAPRPRVAVGTPQYMSPEQATGTLPTAAADVWSLGAILYEVCAGRPLRAPGRASDVLSHARKEAAQGTPRLHFDDELSPELAAIVARALASDPRDRYRDAHALAEDLGNFLDGRRVTAHAYSARALLMRFVRAWRVPLAVAAVALLLVTVLVIVGLVRLHAAAEEARTAQRRAEASEAQAQVAFEAASHDLARSLLAQAVLRSDKGAGPEAELLAAHALAQRESAMARGVLATWGGAPSPELALRSPLPRCLAPHLSNDGRLLLCRDEDGISAWSLEGNVAPTLRWQRPGNIRTMAVAGMVVAAFIGNVDLVILDAATGVLLEEHIVPCEARLDGFEGRVVAYNNGCFWSVATGEPLGHWIHPCLDHGIIGAFAVDATRERWAALCEDGTLIQGGFGDLPAQWTTASTVLGGTDVALAAAFFGDDIVAGSADGDVVVLDGATGVVRAELPTGFSKVVEVASSADGRLVLARASSGAVTLLEPRLGIERGRLPDLRPRLAKFVGDHVITVGDDLRHYRVMRTTPNKYDLGSGVTSLDFDPSGTYLAATSGYRLEVRRVSDGTPVMRTTEVGGFIKGGVFARPSTHYTLTYTSRKPSDPIALHSWETMTWQEVARTPLTFAARRIAARADGTLLAMPYRGGVMAVNPDGADDAWHWLIRDSERGADLSSSPNGRFAVVLGEDTGLFQRIAAGDWAGETIGIDTTARSAAIANDGVLIATAGEGRVTLWDADTGAITGWHEAPLVSFTRVAISADQRWLAAGSRDGNTWLWEVGTLRLVATMAGHDERVSALAFSPDSTLLASGSWDGKVRLFRLGRMLTPGRELATELEASWGRRLDEILDQEE